MIAAAKARGVDVDCDSYPYAAGSNPLKNILPPWVQAGGVEAMIARLGQNETRQRIRADIARDGLNNWGRIPSWDCVQISISPHLPQFSGRTIASLAAERGADPIDTSVRLSRRRSGRDPRAGDVDLGSRHPHHRRLAARLGRLRRQLRRALRHRRQGHAASALLRHVSAHPVALCARRESAAACACHPQNDRRHGARAEAQDRGLLREGFCADVVLFDPDDFTDRATYADPHQFPSGARTTVIVNGTSWSRTRPIPGRCRAKCCAATPPARWAE